MLRAVLILFAILSGCYNPGQYGYDRYYTPLRAERQLDRESLAVPYNDLRADPADFIASTVGWFGVVTSLEQSPDGTSLVHMSFRTHQDRHLCADRERQTCRVTVSQASSGPFTARLALRPEDAEGRNRINPESLLKVYCRPTTEYDAEGGPVLDCSYYRHWPRGQWVDTGAREQLRR